MGDIVLLSAGDEVCADGVVFEKNDLGISKASLTGTHTHILYTYVI